MSGLLPIQLITLLAAQTQAQPQATNELASWLQNNGPWGIIVVLGSVIGVLARAYVKSRDSENKTVLKITQQQTDLLDRVVVAIESSKTSSDNVAKALERHTQELSDLTKELARGSRDA